MILRSILLALFCLALGSSGSWAAEYKAYKVRATTQRTFQELESLDAGSKEEGLAEAIALLTQIAEKKRKPNFDRSMAYELRAHLQLELDGDQSAFADQLIQSFQFAPADDYRRMQLLDDIRTALISARRVDDALRFLEDHADDARGGEAQANFLRAELLAERGDLEEAVSAIGSSNGPDDRFETKTLRYVLLVTLGRWTEAKEVLLGFGEDPYDPNLLDGELQSLQSLQAHGASAMERRDLAVAFTDALEAEHQDPQFISQHHPLGTVRCRSFSPLNEAQVQLRFDVSATGLPENVKVLYSTQSCFTPHVVKAAAGLRYQPATISSHPVPSRGLEATVVFNFSGPPVLVRGADTTAVFNFRRASLVSN